jgi:protein neuralized
MIANTFHTTANTSSLLNSVPSNEGSCVICTENKVDSVFYECGHMATCYMCSMNLKQKNHNCPVCRAPIKDFIRVYKSNLN